MTTFSGKRNTPKVLVHRLWIIAVKRAAHDMGGHYRLGTIVMNCLRAGCAPLSFCACALLAACGPTPPPIGAAAQLPLSTANKVHQKG